MLARRLSSLAVLLSIGAVGVAARLPQTNAGLADTTLLVIRHAEKPADGPELAPAGVTRAAGYPAFFRTYRIDGKPVHIDAIFATADSKGSHRERLTVEPLAKSLGLPIENAFKNKQVDELATALKEKPHGKTVLICWHHGKIPELLTDLGADSAKLLPGGKWPSETFNWVIQLRYDHDGRLQSAVRR